MVWEQHVIMVECLELKPVQFMLVEFLVLLLQHLLLPELVLMPQP